MARAIASGLAHLSQFVGFCGYRYPIFLPSAAASDRLFTCLDLEAISNGATSRQPIHLLPVDLDDSFGLFVSCSLVFRSLQGGPIMT